MYYIVSIIHFNHVHERTMALLSVATADPVYFVAGDKSTFLPPTFFLSPFVAFRYITTLRDVLRAVSFYSSVWFGGERNVTHWGFGPI